MERSSITLIELDQLFTKYKEFILKFTAALKAKYNVSENPIHYTNHNGAVPKKGELTINGERIIYNYHGVGCSVDYNGVMIKFDILPYDTTIKLSSWEFEKFLVSYLNLNDGELSTEKSEKYLQMLEEIGSVEKMQWPNGQYIYCATMESPNGASL